MVADIFMSNNSVENQLGRHEARLDANDRLADAIQKTLTAISKDVQTIAISCAAIPKIVDDLRDKESRIQKLEAANNKSLGEKTVWTLVCSSIGSGLTLAAEFLMKQHK